MRPKSQLFNFCLFPLGAQSMVKAPPHNKKEKNQIQMSVSIAWVGLATNSADSVNQSINSYFFAQVKSLFRNKNSLNHLTNTVDEWQWIKSVESFFFFFFLVTFTFRIDIICYEWKSFKTGRGIYWLRVGVFYILDDIQQNISTYSMFSHSVKQPVNCLLSTHSVILNRTNSCARRYISYIFRSGEIPFAQKCSQTE